MNYPKDVWSPTGGWYPNPRKWKRNFVMVATGAACWVSFWVYIITKKTENDKIRNGERIPLIRFAHLFDEEKKNYDLLKFHHNAERKYLASKKLEH